MKKVSNRYFFDKRDWKRRAIKYGVIFFISFFPVVAFNIFCSDFIGHDWLVILIDCLFLLIFIIIGNWIAEKIFEKRDAKLERLRKERDEAEARKKQILEDSYKKKREEKQKRKSTKNNGKVEVIIEGEVDVKGEEIEVITNKSSTQKKTTRKKKPTIIKGE